MKLLPPSCLLLITLIHVLVYQPSYYVSAFCTSAAIGTTTIAPTSVTSQIATGCTLNANSNLYFTGTSIPALPTAGVVEMQFVGGTISNGGYIQITGPTTANAATRVPMKVLISRNSFGNGGAVLVTGSYPPDSNITISFNTFVSSTACPGITWIVVYYFVTVIAYVDVVPIVLNARAEINSQYNNIATNAGSLSHSIPFVVNAISFYANASARIKGNTISTVGTSVSGNTWVILYDRQNYVVSSQTYAYFRYLGSGASWEFDGNWMKATTSNIYVTYIGDSAIVIDSTVGGTYSISRNYFISVPLADTICLSGTSGNVATNFNFIYIGNTFEVYNFANYMTTIAVSLYGDSRYVFDGNTFISANANAGFYVAFNSITLFGRSRLTVSNNKFTTVSSTRFDGLQLINGLVLYDSTSVSLTGNSMDASTRTTTYKLLTLGTSSLSSAAKVFVCRNNYFGTRMVKFNFNLAANANLLALPLRHCTGTQTPSVTASHTRSKHETLSVMLPLTPSLRASQTASLVATMSETNQSSPTESMSLSISGSITLTRSSTLSAITLVADSTNTTSITDSLVPTLTGEVTDGTSSRSVTVVNSLTPLSSKSRTSSQSHNSKTLKQSLSDSPSPSLSDSKSFSASLSVQPTSSKTTVFSKSHSPQLSQTETASLSVTPTATASSSVGGKATVSYLPSTTHTRIITVSDTASLAPPPTPPRLNSKSISLTRNETTVTPTLDPSASPEISESVPATLRSLSFPRSLSHHRLRTASIASTNTVHDGSTASTAKSETVSHFVSTSINYSATHDKHQTITAPVVITTEPIPTNATRAPDPYFAPDMDNSVSDAIFQSAMEGGSAAVIEMAISSSTKCHKLERLLVRSTVLTPLYLGDVGGSSLPFRLKSYGDVIAVNGVILLSVSVLGIVSVLVRFCMRRGDGLLRAASVMRFPATAIQTLIFLSSGTAVAAGLLLSQNSIAYPVAAIAILVMVLAGWSVVVSRVGFTVKEAERDVIDYDDDEFRSQPRRTRPSSRILLCAEVRPSLEAQMIGPAAEDLRVHPSHWATFVVTSGLPIVLFAASVIVGYSEACEHLPLVAAIAVLVYLVLILAFRPFLGITHNASEFVWSLSIAACLISVWVTFNDNDIISSVSDGERDSLLCFGCILSCRYPFILARALDVVLPKVVSATDLLGSTSTDRSTANDDNERALIVNAVGVTAEPVDEAAGFRELSEASEGKVIDQKGFISSDESELEVDLYSEEEQSDTDNESEELLL